MMLMFTTSMPSVTEPTSSDTIYEKVRSSQSYTISARAISTSRSCVSSAEESGSTPTAKGQIRPRSRDTEKPLV
ncbi:hypothetical protein MIMGU_mgv1a017455mg [Erythranthe guttata]|uniref:Uncharacterized protein n=1 Tax=Erythranthe guttata TaxID=4155 RepID=A0A022R7P4_ERYGU|nr:hypothetical protein MIMGU_mgv1a017455mg [Erythranthe guttata]